MSLSKSQLYTTNILEKRFHLDADEFGLDPDQIFLSKLKKEIEGRCIKEGYVKRDSVKILGRTLGKINQAYFTGLPVYDVKYQADICNPPIGSIIDCRIKEETKMGLVCQIDDDDNPLDIIVPSQYHFGDKRYSMLQTDMSIKVKITNKRHSDGDNMIAVLAILHTTPFDEDYRQAGDESIASSIPSQKEDDDDEEN